MRPVKQNPNAATAIGTGGALGVLLYLASLAGLHVPNPPLEVSLVLGSACSAVALAIGREGIRGLLLRLWRGQ